MYSKCIYIIASAMILSACATLDKDAKDDTGVDYTVTGDSDPLNVCKDPKADADGDGISNGDEGCLTGRDTDGDKIPDWQDFDSDDDLIYDDIEKGEKDAQGKCKGKKAPKNAWPCDTDGDGVPDYLDLDSDGDGLLDTDEDTNGDGLLGCCLSACNKPGTKQAKSCILSTDGCGSGQKCVAGACTPAIDFSCSNGETNPRKKDTFGDGVLDNERGTFICRDATEDNPKGRKAVVLKKNSTGNWHIALEKDAKYADLKISGAGAKEAAGVIDMDSTKTEVAGFVLTRDTTKANVQDELSAILAAINASPPGGPGTVAQTASGTQIKSHDRYDSIQGTILNIKLSTASNVSSVRNALVGTLLGKTMGTLGTLPTPYGSSYTDFVIRFVTVKRFEFKKDSSNNLVKDSKGFPVDSGDTSKWRLVIMGAVAGANNYVDPTRATGIAVEDLSNGSALATAQDKVVNECDVGKVGGMPVADILWVVDTSGSMYNNQADVANNANNFFSRALSSGLDFRMAVMPACDTQKICKGRFLLSSEQTAFSTCIKSPGSGSCEQGLSSAYKAVKAALPRSAGSQTKIRPGAKLVIIQVSDELPAKPKSSIGYGLNTCTLSAAQSASLDQHLLNYKALYTGASDPEGAATMHGIAGVCSNTCGAEIGHGYMELAQLTGGQMGDICQKNLGNTLQVIIDSIVAGSSPVKLEYVPISSSVAVALDGTEIKRSRTSGFDYRSANNALVFLGVKYKKGAEVIASYKRWARQEIIK